MSGNHLQSRPDPKRRRTGHDYFENDAENFPIVADIDLLVDDHEADRHGDEVRKYFYDNNDDDDNSYENRKIREQQDNFASRPAALHF